MATIISAAPKFKTQQIQVATPPLIGSVIVGGWDDGYWRSLNLSTLRQLWRQGELIQPNGKLDTRNLVTATLAATAVIGDVASAELTVPAGELWFIQALRLISPAECAPGEGQITLVNFRVSSWPDDDGSNSAGKLFFAAGRGTIVLDTYWVEAYGGAPFTDPENLGTPIRLVGGDKITLYATLAGANATAALAATLTPYGYKAQLLGL